MASPLTPGGYFITPDPETSGTRARIDGIWYTVRPLADGPAPKAYSDVPGRAGFKPLGTESSERVIGGAGHFPEFSATTYAGKQQEIEKLRQDLQLSEDLAAKAALDCRVFQERVDGLKKELRVSKEDFKTLEHTYEVTLAKLRRAEGTLTYIRAHLS